MAGAGSTKPATKERPKMNKIEQEIIKGGNYTSVPNGTVVEKTTFWQDFTIAELVSGVDGVLDTYERAFKGWKEDIRYMTALCIVLNWKISDHFGQNDKLARTYDKLWKKCDSYILECEHAGTKAEKFVNFTNEEVHYFLRATD